MIKSLTVSCILVLFLFHAASAQYSIPEQSDSSGCSHTWTYVGIGGAVVLTAVLFHFDQQVYSDLYRWKLKNPAVQKISPVITDLGDGAVSFGIFGGFTGYGVIFKDAKAVEVGKIGLESLLLTGAAVQLLKHLCSRERPSAATRSGGFWHGPFAFFRKTEPRKGIASFDAFPSGHTATVFSAATTIADFYPQPWVSTVCYSLATVTALSRITESTHWISDCFVGAIIGYYGTKLIERWNDRSGGLTLLPYTNGEQSGMLLRIPL